MDVTAYIRELLFGHDCVIVPGFGGFLANYTPARVDKDTDTFYPPVKKISFNRNLNNNDGLLVGRISESQKVSFGDARSRVDEFVADIRKRLEKGERVVFDKIGTFINNNEGNVQFEPDENVNYLLDSYGLESFYCSPLEGYDVNKRISAYETRGPVQHSSLRKALWRAAVIIPLLSVVVAVSLKTDLFRSKADKTSMNPLLTEEFENNKKAVDAKINLETVKSAPAEAPEVVKVSPAEKVTPPVASESSVSSSYYVITGSFRSKVNADIQVEQLKEEGFSPEVIETKGFYRVCAISCGDLNTAQSKKDSIINKFPGTWISGKK